MAIGAISQVFPDEGFGIGIALAPEEGVKLNLNMLA